MSGPFPRLAVISDVTVRDGDGCSQALFRLLESYPRDRLTIVQLRERSGNGRRALDGAEYVNMPTPWNRLLFTRLHGVIAIFEYFYRSLRYASVASRVKRENPEIVLTVIEKLGWITAFKVAQRLRLPLHVIVYDGPEHWYAYHPVLGSAIIRVARRTLRYAQTRHSISIPLEAKMAEISGVSGSVLLPFRSQSDEPLARQLSQIPRTAEHRSAVYFGSIASLKVFGMLDRFAREIGRFGLTLDAWGGLSPTVTKSPQWPSRAFRHHGFFPDRTEFLKTVRTTASLLYLPFPFDDEVTRYSFPSKMVDYTLIGIPIVVHAPRDTAVAAWCEENRSSAKLFTHLDWQAISGDLRALLGSDSTLRELADGAFAAGAASFSHAHLFQRFVAAVTRTPAQGSAG
ncbi:MAG: hypothetical protein MUE49_13670 [Rhodospirillales bacterium]|nr:hypothetical protein [Rhodospirillales bacterium]